MAQVTANATRMISAPPERVLELLRHYRETRPKILPEADGSLIERASAPLGLRRIYGEILDKLAAAVQGG